MLSLAKHIVSDLLKSQISKNLFIVPFAQFSGKDIKYGRECRERILKGVEKLTDAVEVTLGPKGRNVIIEQSWGAPKITKDGVTVAKQIEFSDKFMNIGASLVKQVCNKTNDEAGDGTTTAAVLTRAIFKEAVKSISSGLNPMDVKKGMDKAVEEVIKDLKRRSKPVKSKEQITDVATISANGDKTIGKLIADLVDKVGEHGTITVSDGKTLTHEKEVVEGMKFDRGFISPYFITNVKLQKVELENPLILLSEKKITSIQSILHILDYCAKENRSLLIIAEDVESEALTTMILNKMKGLLRVCAVKSPGFGDYRKAMMNDVAILTGGTVISEDVGMTIEKCDPQAVLGKCKEITVTKDDTLILHGVGKKESIEERINQIKDQIKVVTSDYDKEKLQERLGKLKGGVGIIKVGGGSEIEVNEIKDRINDAIHATKAAIDEGIVIGGGCALLYGTKILEKLKGENFDQNMGIKIIANALKMPCKILANNSGAEGSLVVQKLLEQKDETYGFDAYNCKFVNMIKAGIIDPTKVVRTALINSSSIAGMMNTTEAMIVEEDAKKSKVGPVRNPPADEDY